MNDLWEMIAQLRAQRDTHLQSAERLSVAIDAMVAVADPLKAPATPTSIFAPSSHAPKMEPAASHPPAPSTPPRATGGKQVSGPIDSTARDRRDEEVRECVLEGKTLGEIAEECRISYNTAWTICQRLKLTPAAAKKGKKPGAPLTKKARRGE